MAVPRPPQNGPDPAALTAFKNLKDKVQSGIQRYRGGAMDPRPQRGPHTSDFARLARRICGKSIGVVLGGGGARGISHLVGSLYSLPFQLMLSFREYCELWKSTGFLSITSEVSTPAAHGGIRLLMPTQGRV